jgi:hypothetical protein
LVPISANASPSQFSYSFEFLTVAFMMATSLRIGKTSQRVIVGASQDSCSMRVQSALLPRSKSRNFVAQEECQLCKSVLRLS